MSSTTDSIPIFRGFDRLDNWLDFLADGSARGIIALTLHTNLFVYGVLALLAPSSTATTIYGVASLGLLGLRWVNARSLASPSVVAWLTWAVMHSCITSAAILQDGVWTISILYYLTTPLPILLALGWRSSIVVIAINVVTWLSLAQLELSALLPVPLRDLSDLYWPVLLFVGLAVSISTMPLAAYLIQRRLSDQLSERNRLLETMQSDLRTQRTHQEQFVASVSHELRTPMNAILGFLQAVDPQTVTDEEDQEMLDHMSTSATQLLQIINDLLDFSQLEAKRLRLLPRPFHLHNLVREVTQSYRLELKNKGVGFTLSMDSQSPWVMGDPERLGQILQKLLENALKFTDHGEVRVCLTRGDSGSTQLVIQDSGRGINPHELSRIFDRFSNVTSRTRRNMGGTGLGLPIVQALVGLMGGSVTASSVHEHGSTFTVNLPLPSCESPASATDSSSISFQQGPTKGVVLIVDDSPVNRMVAKHLLRSDFPDLTLIEAEDALSAMDMMRAQAVDLILMDVIMPQTDGIEATRQILASPGLHDPWVVGLTADTTDDVVQRCLDAGMRSVLTKPFERQVLSRTIAGYLRQKQSLKV